MMPVDIETQVREYTESLVSATQPILLEDIEQGVADQPQLNGKPLLVSRSRRHGLGRGLLVATSIAAVVLLVGLIGLVSNPIDESEPAATVPAEPVVTVPESPAPEPAPFDSVQWPGLTDDIPEGVESGMLTTPLGTARWVHLTSEEFTLPGLGELDISADDGFRITQTRSADWQSDDGIEWHSEVPEGSEMMYVPYVDASYGVWLFIAEDPLEMHKSEGGPGRQVDLSGLVAPDSDGFTWNLDISRPLIRYRPETTQSVFHVWFTGPDGQVNQRLLVLEGSPEDSATYVEVPWDVHSDVTLFGTSETFFAYVQDSDSNQISVWRTDDGYTWTDFGLLHTQLGVRSSLNFEFSVLPALQVLQSENPRPTPIRNQVIVVTTPGGGWESTNGIDWTPVPEGLPDGTQPVRLESGWFATDGDLWWMHVGDNWVSLAELGMERSDEGCEVAPRASGQTTLFWSTCIPDTSQEFPTDLWIISLDS